MNSPLPKLPALPSPQRSRSRRERRCDAARKPVTHVVMPGMEVAREEIKPRETIAAFLRRTGWATKDKRYGWQFKRGLPTVLEVNGESVLRKNWRSTRIAANDNVRFVSFPMGGSNGGGAKQVIGLVALIAVSAFALWAGPLIASTFFAGSTLAGGLATAAIGLGGSLLVNALVSPKAGATNAPNATQDQIYSVAAQGNTAKLGQPLPVWYGRLKTFPDFAATPWGEFVGNDQYLNVLLSVGMGSLSYENLYIDDTILWDHSTGVQSQFTNAQVAFYEPGDAVTLFPTNVDSSVEVTGQELPDGTGSSTPVFGLTPSPGAPLGPFVTNPPATLAQSLAVDFVLPAGCFGIDPSDKQQLAHPAAIRLIAEYAPVNDAGTITGSFTSLFDVIKVYASKSPIRDSVKVDVTPGRYTVRFSRGDAGLTSDKGVSACIWAGLRSFLKGNNSFPDVSTVAIRLLANQSTQGSYKFGVLATRKLPVWNGSAFVTQATRNNGWAFLDAVTNSQYGSGLPISKVDFNTIVNFAAGCTTRGDTFDYNFTAAVAVPAAFDKILTASRARHFWLGDTVSVVRDEWRDVPSMLLTDREIVRDSTQVTWTMLGDEDPDAVIVEYIDENTWLPAQVQYPPDDEFFTAQNAQVQRIDGIINRDHAFRECAFYYLQSIYRRENVQINVEYEGRAIQYGSVLRVQSELPMAYGYGGAVVGVSGHALTLDPAPVWDTGPFYVRLRMPNGTYFGPVTATMGANASIANLNSTSLAAAETAQSTTLSAVLAREDGGEYPSFELGTGDSQSKLCVVLSGVPNGELCTLSLVVDDVRVHATDLGTPPVLPVGQFPTNASLPLIVGLNAMFGQGTAEPKLSASWFPSEGAVYYVADVSYDSGTHWQQVYEGQGNEFSEVVTLAALTLRVQAVTTKVHGPYSSIDLAAPTIVISDNTVALNSLIDGIKYQVTTIQDYLNDKITDIEQRFATLQSSAGAQQWTDTKSVRSQLSSRSDASFAEITRVDTVQTSATAALATSVDTVTARVGATEASIVVNEAALATLDGFAAAQYSVTLDVNGYASGFNLFNGGAGVSTATFLVDKFQIASPGVTGGLPVPIFTVANVSGSPKIGIRGDMFIDGTLTGTMIQAGTIQAVNIAANTITAAKIATGAITSASGAIGSLSVNSLSIGDNAVTVPATGTLGSAVVGNGASQNVITVNVVMDTTGLGGKTINALLIFIGQQGITGSTGSWAASVSANGSTVGGSFGGSTFQPSFAASGVYSFTASGAPGDGFTARAVFTSASNYTLTGGTLAVIGTKR